MQHYYLLDTLVRDHIKSGKIWEHKLLSIVSSGFPCFSSVYFTQFCQLRTTPLPYLSQTSCLTPKPWIQPPVVKLHCDGQTGYVNLTLSWRINFEELPKFCTLVILRAEKCSEGTYWYMEYKTMDSASGSGDNERHNFEVFDVDDP